MDTIPDLFRERARDTAVLTWYRLIRVVKKARRYVVDPIREQAMSGGQFDLLVEIGRNDGTTQTEVAESLGVTAGNVTQHLDRLEERGLVVREPAGRSNALHLTEAGQALVADMVPRHDDGVRRVLEPLTAAELKELSRLLRKVERGL